MEIENRYMAIDTLQWSIYPYHSSLSRENHYNKRRSFPLKSRLHNQCADTMHVGETNKLRMLHAPQTLSNHARGRKRPYIADPIMPWQGDTHLSNTSRQTLHSTHKRRHLSPRAKTIGEGTRLREKKAHSTSLSSLVSRSRFSSFIP
jgi:hypothetical protein